MPDDAGNSPVEWYCKWHRLATQSQPCCVRAQVAKMHLAAEPGLEPRQRPGTVATALWLLANWLDEADGLIADLADRTGLGWTHSDDVQVDLRAWANWLREHPNVDAEMREVAWSNGEAWT